MSLHVKAVVRGREHQVAEAGRQVFQPLGARREAKNSLLGGADSVGEGVVVRPGHLARFGRLLRRHLPDVQPRVGGERETR